MNFLCLCHTARCQSVAQRHRPANHWHENNTQKSIIHASNLPSGAVPWYDNCIAPERNVAPGESTSIAANLSAMMCQRRELASAHACSRNVCVMRAHVHAFITGERASARVGGGGAGVHVWIRVIGSHLCVRADRNPITQMRSSK